MTDDLLNNTGNFIHKYILDDLGQNTDSLITRFPPEPNGYLHIGHAKSICLNFGFARIYGGVCNLRFDDTNPAKEDEEYIRSIIEDIKWLGFDYGDRMYFASDYFDIFYEYAVKLIKLGLAYVCDLTAEEIKEHRGTLIESGRESPYRYRGIDENLLLFDNMKNGKYKNGEKTLRARIDMSSNNINMRDPVIYRIAHVPHHKTNDKWVIYPMYDYAHPLEDAIEGVTHSLCSLEFEDHRPLYNWFVSKLGFTPPPRQIEFAKLNITNTIMGKRHLKSLVDNGQVEGWDDPRLLTIAGMRRRGYPARAIVNFCESVGISKANSLVDFSMLEHCVRTELQPSSIMLMAVLNPIEVLITNYPDDSTEYLVIDNHAEDKDKGSRLAPFSNKLYIEAEDFMEEAPKKFFRLSINKEVRLKGAYIIRCDEVIKDNRGNIVRLHCTYDKMTKSGLNLTDRKVKGVIHWVSAKHAVKCSVRLFEPLILDDDTKKLNEHSLTTLDNVYIEPEVLNLDRDMTFQFLRKGYFKADESYDKLIFNRIVGLKSSYNP